jgi:hypothetical protein
VGVSCSLVPGGVQELVYNPRDPVPAASVRLSPGSLGRLDHSWFFSSPAFRYSSVTYLYKVMAMHLAWYNLPIFQSAY